ncbi:MAG: glycosyltransferase family 4 protein [Anaerolineaceae bacterium]|nr:glycosyltransferase family 4 protein [Anaerolineaceae bacterium]
MRILTITSNHPPYHSGGYELRIKDIMDGLASLGHQVLVLSTEAQPGSRKRPEISEYPVKRLLHNRYAAKFFPKEVLFDLIDTKTLERIIKKFHPDVIYLGHTYILSKAIMPYLADQSLPIVYDEGGTCLKGAWTERGRWFDFTGDYQSRWVLLNKIKPFVTKLVVFLSNGRIKPHWRWPQQMRVFFNSQSSLAHSLSFGVPVHNAEVIHSGIVLEKFPFLPRTKMEEPIKILCPGRLEPRKGQLDAIKLISILAAAGIQAELTLVGETPSQSFLEQIKGKIKSVGFEESVRLSGMVSQKELAELYQKSDICFFSSHHPTGFSRTPLEAMASGCLVITFGCEGSSEIIADSVNGFIIEPDGVEQAVGIINLLSSHPVVFKNFVIDARIFVEKKFTFESYIEAIESFLLEKIGVKN